MINNLLHAKAEALDGAQHLNLKVKLPVTDWRVASRLNALFVAAAEFGDACKEFPIVFIHAGVNEQNKPEVAPVAVFGLAQEENLFLDGPNWRGRYMPAVLQLYPFAIGRIDPQNFAICVDRAWPGVSEGEGEPLFDADGKPAALTKQVIEQCERTETEVQRTRAVGQRLLELELLREMRFDVTMPDNSTVSVDGFFTVDEQKLKALPDATLVELSRTGLMGLIHAHLISMGNMRRLAEWRLERVAAAKAN